MTVFVEEYRKELSLTGYPFSVLAALKTDTGYAILPGTVEDASVYAETASKLPVFTNVSKKLNSITFAVGPYNGRFSLDNIPEVLSLYADNGLFGGIFVLNKNKIRFLESWKDGEHAIVPPIPFCPRCIEVLPHSGVSCLVSDDGNMHSGNVVISGGQGTTLRLLDAPSSVRHIEVNFVGDPTYTYELNTDAIRSIICCADSNCITLTGDEYQAVSLVACNFDNSNVYEDALRIEGYDSTVRINLGGK